MIYWLIIVTSVHFIGCCFATLKGKSATWWLMPGMLPPMIWAIVKLWSV